MICCGQASHKKLPDEDPIKLNRLWSRLHTVTTLSKTSCRLIESAANGADIIVRGIDRRRRLYIGLWGRDLGASKNTRLLRGAGGRLAYCLRRLHGRRSRRGTRGSVRILDRLSVCDVLGITGRTRPGRQTRRFAASPVRPAIGDVARKRATRAES